MEKGCSWGFCEEGLFKEKGFSFFFIKEWGRWVKIFSGNNYEFVLGNIFIL